MTPEEAIKSLSAFIDNEAYTDKFQSVCKLAVKALQKQIPKKPYWERCDLNCKVCGEVVYADDNYCLSCGQAIDWT